MALTALYVHVPFCAQKCRYCDFDSKAVAPRERGVAMDRYFEQLGERLERVARVGALDGIETVYIGGGTPTLAGQRLVRLAKRIVELCHPAEFTCEANPESIDAALALELSRAGVTRVSIGVQSLDPSELLAIGRIHTAERALLAINDARCAGLDVSCDLMCGLPGQTASSWDDTLQGILDARPHHISVYPLTLEEGTPLYRAAHLDCSLEPDEDFQADCMDRARKLFLAAGYEPYEVASYAQAEHACRHNMAYWTGRGYLGLGRSAAGMLDRDDFDRLAALFPGVVAPPEAARVRLVQLDDAAARFEAEFLSEREAICEDLMLACRMTRGITGSLLVRAGRILSTQTLGDACDQAIDLGLASWVTTRPDVDRASISSKDVIEGRIVANLAPTHLGWLEGNVLFELFWDLHEHLV